MVLADEDLAVGAGLAGVVGGEVGVGHADAFVVGDAEHHVGGAVLAGVGGDVEELGEDGAGLAGGGREVVELVVMRTILATSS